MAQAFARKHGKDVTLLLLGRSLSAPHHERLSGTLLDVKRSVEELGSTAIPIRADLRHVDEVIKSVRSAIRVVGGLEVLINNASALELKATRKCTDLLYEVNTRATLLLNAECRPALEANRGSIVTMSPPIRKVRIDWISPHPAYTISKYSMTLATLSAASHSIRANCLWPRHTVATHATKRLEDSLGVDGVYSRGRPPEDVADAVYALATSESTTGRSLYDDEVLQNMPSTNAPLDLFSMEDTRSLRRG